MKIFTFYFSLLFTLTLSAQSWVTVSSIPTGRHHPVTFTLDGKGYAVTGTISNGSLTDDFYEYDPITDSWTTLTDFPGAARSYSIGADHNGVAYMGFGVSSTQYLKDLWKYDAQNDQWTQLASCPCSGRAHPSFIPLGDKIYVGLGNNNISDLKDWWEYDIPSNSWTQMSDLPGPPRHHPFHFNADGEVYAGMGHSNQTIFDDWYKLDTTTNSWTAMNSFPGEARVAGTQFDYNNFGFVLSGDGDNHSYMQTGEMWRYNPSNDTWLQMTPHPGISRWAPGSFVIDDEVYFFGGRNRQNGQYPSTVVKYDLGAAALSLEEDIANQFSIYPNPANDFIYWESNEDVDRIEIINGVGQIFTVELGTESRIDVSQWQNGIYIVQFYGNKEVKSTKKIIIQH